MRSPLVPSVVALFAALGLGVVAAHGSIIPEDPVLSGIGPITWSYPTDLSVNSEARPGDWFVIYDFGQYVPGSIFAPPGWTASAQLTTAPPAGVILLHPDNPAETNLVFTYNGTTSITNPSLTTSVPLGLFGAQSTTALRTIEASAYFNHDLTNPSFIPATGQNLAPVPVPVPEPAAAGVLALGVLPLLRRRRG